MNTDFSELIDIASSHLGKGVMDSSARLCIENAKNMIGKGFSDESIIMWIAKSMKYSVGIANQDFQNINQLISNRN